MYSLGLGTKKTFNLFIGNSLCIIVGVFSNKFMWPALGQLGVLYVCVNSNFHVFKDDFYYLIKVNYLWKSVFSGRSMFIQASWGLISGPSNVQIFTISPVCLSGHWRLCSLKIWEGRIFKSLINIVPIMD